ncbi:ATR-interacting protein-like [Tubulanus polymorphus]|uniref:ATR-interacting protein-like n=1 Tax=Tubulanus polymorphus TaxID=672921 RepID=UPI003DA1CDF1
MVSANTCANTTMCELPDSLWDESDDFSGDQLEKIDIMASQALGIADQNNASSVRPKTMIATASSSLSASEGYHSYNDEFGGSMKSRSIQSNVPQFNNSAFNSGLVLRNNESRISTPTFPSVNKTNQQQHGLYSESLAQEVQRLKTEVLGYKEQMRHIRVENYSKDGQINMLRQSLTQKESELFRVKQEKLDSLRLKDGELSMKQKELESELSKMKTDILFKDREIVELQTTNKNLEKQVQINNNHISVRSPKGPMRDSQSPRHSGNSPSKFGEVANFPTAQSFIGDCLKSKPVTDSRGVQCDVSMGNSPLTSKRPIKHRKHHLRLKISSGEIPGPCLVSKLLPNYDHSSSNCGMIGLFNDRSETGVCSNPNIENRLSAYEAFHVLLNSKSTIASTVECGQYWFNCQIAETLKVLPSIKDYLQNYINCVDCRNKPLLRTQSSTGSFHGSSLDSLSDLVAGHASTDDNALEVACELARNSLHVLLQLVIHCQPIRDCLVCNRDSTSDFCGSSIFSILQKLLLMKNDEGMTSKAILSEECLQVLIALARESATNDLQRFSSLLEDGTVLDCLLLSDKPQFLMNTLNLLNCLLASPLIVSTLCAPSDNCVLSCLYGICIKPSQFPVESTTAISHKIVCLLMCLVRRHRYGALMLLQTECHCSSEVIKAVFSLMYRELRNDSEQSHLVLRHGLMLLHWFSEWDQHFVKHSAADDHKYISVISKLEMIYKNLPNIPHYERELLQDLWESADVEENSQEEDSVTQVPMDIS